jgi:acetylornithine/N-succinyldiaminopimelate aminotransferase
MLLILDEVQSGYGRTGKFFAHEWAGIEPDIMAVAKGIGSGFPLGACLAKGEVAKSMGPGTHGSTYGGNPLASAVGNAVLDRMLEPGFFEHVERMGQRLAWHRSNSSSGFRNTCWNCAARDCSPGSGSRRRFAKSPPGCATSSTCSP